MNSGSSAFCSEGVCSVEAFSVTSCHHTSRPSWNATSSPLRLTTTTCWTELPPFSRAASTAGLSVVGLPRR